MSAVHIAMLVIHFVAMILGVGQIGALILVAAARVEDGKLVGRLMTSIAISVPVVFLSGVALVAMAKDHPEGHLWLRLVALLTITLGITATITRRWVGSGPLDMDRLRGRAWAMSGLTALIVILIAAKPG